MKRNVIVALFALLFILGTAAIAIAAGGPVSQAGNDHSRVMDIPDDAGAEQAQEQHRFRAEPCATACHAGYRIQNRAELRAGMAEAAADDADPIRIQERTRTELRLADPDRCEGPCRQGPCYSDAATCPAEPTNQAPDDAPLGPHSTPGPNGAAPFSGGPNCPSGPDGPAAGPPPDRPSPGNADPGNPDPGHGDDAEQGNPEPGKASPAAAIPGNAQPGNPSTGNGTAGNQTPGGESSGRQGSGSDSPAQDQTRHRDLESSGAGGAPHRG